MKQNIRWHLKQVFSIRAMDILMVPDLTFSPVLPVDDDLEVEILREEDIPELMEFHDSRCIQRSGVFTREEVLTRLKSGHMCSCARHRGNMSGFVWFAPLVVFAPDLHCEFKMNDGGVMIYNVFIASEHRGRKVLPTVLNMSFRKLAELGYSRSYAFIHHENRSSKKTLEKYHSQTCGIIFHGFAAGCYFLLPFIRNNAGIRVRLCSSPWYRWQEVFRKRPIGGQPTQ